MPTAISPTSPLGGGDSTTPRHQAYAAMTISEPALILAGGTTVLAILFGIRLAIQTVAGGGAAALQPRAGAAGPRGRIGRDRLAGVIAPPPLIFLGSLAAAAVLEAVVPLPLLA